MTEEIVVTQLDYPTVLGYRSPRGTQLWIWCEHERCWHFHGACSGQCNADTLNSQAQCTCPPGTADGHRVSHCRCPRSPLKSDYIVKEAGPLTAEVKRGKRETRAAGCPSCRRR